MRKISFILSLLPFLGGCKNQNNISNANNTTTMVVEKGVPPVIIIDETPVKVETIVNAFSFDSILVKTIFRNESSNNIYLYKPLLPFEGFTGNLYSVLSKVDYEPVHHTQQSKEKFVMDEGSPTYFVIPNLQPNNLLLIKPNDTLSVEANIASKYDFAKFKQTGGNEFGLIYDNYFPLIENGRQVTAIDSIDKNEKPVFYEVTVSERSNPDSMKTFFKVPLK